MQSSQRQPEAQGMFKVHHRYAGEGLWTMGGPPLTAQAAFGSARDLSADKKSADEVRVVPSSAPRIVDVKV
jgi:hypothetical protein